MVTTTPANIHKLNPVDSKDRDGRMPPRDQHIVGTLALIQRDVGLHAIEIGTLYGETTTNIARAMPKHIIITVDIPSDVPPKFPLDEANLKHLGKTPEFGEDVISRIVPLRTDSADLDLAPGIDIGFALIDGAHTYDYAWNDFRKIEPFLVSGGIICFHDVGLYPGVGQAVEEIMNAFPLWQWSAYGGTSLAWGRKI